MTPLVDLQRRLFGIAAAWELGMQPPIAHPLTVWLLDERGERVGEVPAVNSMEAVSICRAATNAGWHTRTDGAPAEDGCE